MLTTFYENIEGHSEELEAESLGAMAEILAEVGYAGPHLRIRDEQGFTRGWVGVEEGAPYWRAG